MGVNNGNQITFRLSNVVSRELDLIVKLIRSKGTTINDRTSITTATKPIIDCDISNIIHKLSFQHLYIYSPVLVLEVARFLKKSCCRHRVYHHAHLRW